MKEYRWILLAGILVAALGVLWLLFKPQGNPSNLETTQEAGSQPVMDAQAKDAAGSGTIPSKPRLLKMRGYPPVTPEHKAMWEWWRAMEKADPKFQWKMPIEFYGKVVDQFGEPVAGAIAHLAWTAIDDSHELEMLSGAGGLFTFAGQSGKRLVVSVRKEGYLPTKTARGAFEYAAFFEDIVHIPDENSPVVFRLQKLLGGEPVYVFRAEAIAKPNGIPLILSVHSGKFADAGELSFAVKHGIREADLGQAYTIRVVGRNGTELVATNEEFPFLAPEEGYQDSFVLEQPATGAAYQPTKHLKFYVRLAGGRYAFVGMEISLLSEGTEVRYRGGVRYNEKWSRNLEFDHRKWINR